MSVLPSTFGDVGLGLLDDEVRAPRSALAALVDGGRDEDAGDLAVGAEVRLGDLLAAAHPALVDDADLEIRVRVQEDVLHVAILERDAELVGGSAVDVLDPEVLHLAPLLPPGDQVPLDVGILREGTRVVLRDALRLAAAAEGGQLPSLLSVPGLHRGEPLPRDLGAEAAGPLLHLRPGHLDRRSPPAHAGEHSAPGEPQRLQLLHVGGAAAGRQVLCQDLVEGDGASRAGDGEQQREQQDSHRGLPRKGPQDGPTARFRQLARTRSVESSAFWRGRFLQELADGRRGRP